MRIDGQWLPCDDGVIRPVVPGMVRLADGQWVEVAFLLDAGADRTVFSPDFFDLLQPLEVVEPEPMRLAGVGGPVNSIAVETAIGFLRDDGRSVAVRGTFGVFTEGESPDLPVLGRDVTNNFSVIYDYPHQMIALLAPPHSYEIKRTS
jgi:hypothetical protein